MVLPGMLRQPQSEDQEEMRLCCVRFACKRIAEQKFVHCCALRQLDIVEFQ